MFTPCFFGYGSLVNVKTHAYPNAGPAQVSGWRRVWRQTDQSPHAFLTAEPAPGVSISGLVAQVPGADWVALDAREAGYSRVDITDVLEQRVLTQPAAAIYSIPEGRFPLPLYPATVLLSYLDVVAQGYLNVFGEAGLAAFFDTTFGWQHAPIANDRDTPLYPRWVATEAYERALVDHHLARVGAIAAV